jgi:pyruvate/2-oxoglutarate dehydrogenase complex dihydrolipoamide dehydrogenase (E3) component
MSRKEVIGSEVTDEPRLLDVWYAQFREPTIGTLPMQRPEKLESTLEVVIGPDVMHTSAPNIWAGGDVVGESMLETLAAKEGAIAADNALTGSHKKVDFLSVPSAIFTSPQVASVGFTENR